MSRRQGQRTHIALWLKSDRPIGGQPQAPPALPARRLKVLHLLATMPVGGAEDLVAAIVRGLDPQRFRAAVATLGPPGPVGQELRAQGYEVVSLGLDIKRTSTWRVVAAVRRLLQARRPDILHTHLYHPNLYGRLGALGLGLPGVVAAVHNSYTRVKFHRRLWNFLLGWASDRVLVGSAQVWQDVRHYDGVPASRLLLMPYGIPLAELDTPLSREEARERLGLSGADLVVGAVGRLEEQKGHAYLLAALPELRREIPEPGGAPGGGRPAGRRIYGARSGNWDWRARCGFSAPGGTFPKFIAPWTSSCSPPCGRACPWPC